MNNQNRTIMGACDYSLASLKNIKLALQETMHPNKEINCAIGGIIVTLTSNLLRLCQETLLDSLKLNEGNAKEDLKTIQLKFNAFIDRMINHE